MVRQGADWPRPQRTLRSSKKIAVELQALVRKLDAIEGGRYLLRYGLRLERRSVGESDWLPPSFVWQNDVDLFGGLPRPLLN